MLIVRRAPPSRASATSVNVVRFGAIDMTPQDEPGTVRYAKGCFQLRRFCTGRMNDQEEKLGKDAALNASSASNGDAPVELFDAYSEVE